ncbi:hypothetical protein AAZX31_12G211000 [Glycine max]
MFCLTNSLTITSSKLLDVLVFPCSDPITVTNWTSDLKNAFSWVIQLLIKAISVFLLPADYSYPKMSFLMSPSFLMLNCLNPLVLLVSLCHPLLLSIFPQYLLYLMFRIIFRTPLLLILTQMLLLHLIIYPTHPLISLLLINLPLPLISLLLLILSMFSQLIFLLTLQSLLTPLFLLLLALY